MSVDGSSESSGLRNWERDEIVVLHEGAGWAEWVFRISWVIRISWCAVAVLAQPQFYLLLPLDSKAPRCLAVENAAG